MTTEKKELLPNNLARLTRTRLEEIKSSQWSREDAARLRAAGIPEAQIETGDVGYAISTHGRAKYIDQQGVHIPGSCYVQLSQASGYMNMATANWPNPVDATGKFANGQIFGPASRRFLQPGINQFCMLVGTPSIYFLNTRIPNWGASVGLPAAYWTVGANDGGPCQVAFNDDWDQDNSGVLTQVIRIYNGAAFARAFQSLLE